MKAGTINHMKFALLKARLQLPKYAVVGVLETLWSLTATSAPDGAIGKFSNSEIAAWLEWGGDPDDLIDALIATKFLDTCTENRLIIHDWQEHCPTYIRGNMQRAKRKFAVPRCPTKYDTKEDTKYDTKEDTKYDTKEDTKYGTTYPILSYPSQSYPNTSDHSQANGPIRKREYTPEFEQAWKIYPSRAGGNSKLSAWKAWRARLKAGVTPDELIAGVERYAKYIRATGKENTEYVKQAATFFGPNAHYAEPWEIPAGGNNEKYRNTRKPSLAERVSAGARNALDAISRREASCRSMVGDGVHLRPPVDVEFRRVGDG